VPQTCRNGWRVLSVPCSQPFSGLLHSNITHSVHVRNKKNALCGQHVHPTARQSVRDLTSETNSASDCQNITYGGSPQTVFAQVSSAKNRLSHHYVLLKGVTETVRETVDISGPSWIEVHKNYSVAFFCFFNNQSDALINYQNLFCHKTLHVSGIFCAHHQEFSTVHSALVSFMKVFDDRFQAESGWNCSILTLLGNGH